MHSFLSDSVVCKMIRQKQRASNSRNDELMIKVRNLVRNDRRLAICEMAEEVEISYDSCQAILTENLEMKRVPGKFIPRLLTKGQEQNHMSVSFYLLKLDCSLQRCFQNKFERFFPKNEYIAYIRNLVS